jgi:hypothetical protein
MKMEFAEELLEPSVVPEKELLVSFIWEAISDNAKDRTEDEPHLLKMN